MSPTTTKPPLPKPEGRISDHFTWGEFRCKCGGLYCRGWGNDPDVTLRNVVRLVTTLLEPLRAKIGRPIQITSGIRCRGWNDAVQGEPKSYHLSGRAADLIVQDLPPAKVAVAAEKLPSIGGIGRYAGFVHVDIGLPGRRW